MSIRWSPFVPTVLAVAATAMSIAPAQASQFPGNPHQAPKNPTIIGGSEAAQGEFPYIVSLQSGSFGHFCGGTLVRPDWVLTAAHCVKGGGAISKLRVVIGLHHMKDTQGVETFKVKKAIVHPEYGSKTQQDYDYALIQLSGQSKHTPATLNEAKIDIPDAETSAPIAMTAGWGVTTEGDAHVSDVLMKVELPLVSATRCEAAYSGQITDRMLCAGLDNGGKDSCQGDSGGPLLMKDAKDGTTNLIGVVSWGEGCARPGKFGVYSKVSEAVSWIIQQAGPVKTHQ